jgi:hypothetical protein
MPLPSSTKLVKVTKSGDRYYAQYRLVKGDKKYPVSKEKAVLLRSKLGARRGRPKGSSTRACGSLDGQFKACIRRKGCDYDQGQCSSTPHSRKVKSCSTFKKSSACPRGRASNPCFWEKRSKQCATKLR